MTLSGPNITVNLAVHVHVHVHVDGMKQHVARWASYKIASAVLYLELVYSHNAFTSRAAGSSLKKRNHQEQRCIRVIIYQASIPLFSLANHTLVSEWLARETT